uniref:Isoprenylcysteine carboxylmethyltransferase family protein n=1 Tax=Ignavibacterium album TaxID=591197 RepID=A0A832G8J1_9BACT
MNYFYDVLILIFLLGLFGYTHSVLASLKVKEFIKQQFGNAIAFYRLFYNLFSLVSLYLIWEYAPHPSLRIYKLSPPFDYLVLIPQFISLIGIIWCFRYICFKEFLGLSQIERFLNKEYSEDELDEKMTFRVEGPYKYSRHPIYFFSIVFLVFRAEMDLFYLTMLIAFIIYFYIGSVYEEKKLIRIFGKVYEDYQKEVPRIFPIKIFNNKS